MNFNLSNSAAPLRTCLQIATLALFTTMGLVACGAQRTPDAKQEMTMKPSITYLHLLRHTPFFTSLSTEQLRWVIDHSREWETEAGSVIAKVDQTGASATDYWVLLDGGWRVHYDGSTFPSRHAAPGKWFNIRVAQGANCALITTEHSYVMRITEADMNTMLEKGFAFGHHLDDGRLYYGSMFHSNSQPLGPSGH
jgi:hypothetical protein